ncbi:MAG TPA: AMP-binding protein, partial [Acidimicrobiales bacterium]
GDAPVVAASAAALLRSNGTDAEIAARPALRTPDRIWTHGEVYAEACRYATLFQDRLPAGRPPHVGVLADNIPEYLFTFAGAALIGATVVGLNHTRQGEHLLRDLHHADVGLVITEPAHGADLDPIRSDLGLPAESVLLAGPELEAALPADAADLGHEPDLDTLWALIFTSGTSSAPKAVICTQRRLLVTGNRMRMLMDIGPDDVGYVCMPLFHSNAVMVGWAPSIVAGASVGLARRFSVSQWLPDIRRYGATWFNYTGKPLSYLVASPEQPDDADNPLRVAFGNEGAPDVVERFSRRFGVRVIDAFGATEGGIAVNREENMPAGALGRASRAVQVVDEDGVEKPVARLDADGRLLNPEDCVGEIVNTAGSGPFEGYYNNDEANEKTTRNGWYWSGDLGYLDDDRFLYFAGRTADWIRVDGENFPAGPVEDALVRHPDVIVAAVYGVPDVAAGDQVMATVVVREGVSLDPADLGSWIDAQGDLGPKWRPRYVRVAREVPTTGTNKVLKRDLALQKFRSDRVGSDPVWHRDRGEVAYRPFTADDEAQFLADLTAAGRQRFWDL